MKRFLLMFCMAGMALSLLAGCSGSAQTGGQDENTDAVDGSAEVLENAV